MENSRLRISLSGLLVTTAVVAMAIACLLFKSHSDQSRNEIDRLKTELMWQRDALEYSQTEYETHCKEICSTKDATVLVVEVRAHVQHDLVMGVGTRTHVEPSYFFEGWHRSSCILLWVRGDSTARLMVFSQNQSNDNLIDEASTALDEIDPVKEWLGSGGGGIFDRSDELVHVFRWPGKTRVEIGFQPKPLQ